MSSVFLYLWALMSKTLTSQNSRCPVTQNPRALTSKRASMLLTVDFWLNFSVLNSINVGSIFTSLQISPKSCAVMFRIALCLSGTNPHFLHDNACARLNLFPQEHSEGKRGSSQLYLIRKASQNCSLFTSYPFSLIGKVVSQLYEPFSWFASHFVTFHDHSFPISIWLVFPDVVSVGHF